MQDVVCPYCRANNAPDALFCSNCEQSLIVGKLTSLGTGVLTKGYVWELRPTDQYLGRQVSNDFVVPSNMLAARQLRLSYQNHGFLLTDVANNGICSVNDYHVQIDTPIYDGDTLRVGDETFLYNLQAGQENDLPQYLDPLAAQLQTMLATVSELHCSLNMQETLDNAVDSVLRLTNTQRGFVFFVDLDERGDVELREMSARAQGARALPDEWNAERLSVNQAVIRQVIAGDGQVLIEDAMSQQVTAETIRRFRLRSLVCMPLAIYSERSGRPHVLGVLYADSPEPTGELPKNCRQSLQMLAQILAATILKWQTFDRMKEDFVKYEHAVGALDQEIAQGVQQIEYLQERVNSPEQTHRLGREELSLELGALAARLASVRADLARVGYLHAGL